MQIGEVCIHARHLAKMHEPNWKRIAMEFRRYSDSMGGFHRKLCEAIIRADTKNTIKLRQMYPELVKYLKDVDPCHQS